MDKNQFANCFGFYDYDDMLSITTTVIQDGDKDWNITKLPFEKFLVWDNTEIGDDRVEVFLNRDAAEEYLHLLYRKSHERRIFH